MNEKLKFKNGQELTGNALCSNYLFLYMYKTDMGTVFNLLYNSPANTGTIVYEAAADTSFTYEGYTKLTSVRDEGNGLITAVLQKEA